MPQTPGGDIYVGRIEFPELNKLKEIGLIKWPIQTQFHQRWEVSYFGITLSVPKRGLGIANSVGLTTLGVELASITKPEKLDDVVKMWNGYVTMENNRGKKTPPAK
jgi:hypothetical protein